jgi:fatty acyl-CoA reductase
LFKRLEEAPNGSKPRNKVFAIQGDISMPELGISEQDIQTLINEVSIVFHSAATVKFDEALKTSIEFNVLGTRRVIQLCHKLKELKVRIRKSLLPSNSK